MLAAKVELLEKDISLESIYKNGLKERLYSDVDIDPKLYSIFAETNECIYLICMKLL